MRGVDPLHNRIAAALSFAGEPGGCAVTSPTGGRAIHTSAASGASPPHGHDPAWTGWLPVSTGRRTPAGAPCRVLLSYDGSRKCAWRSRLPWDNLSRGGGERRKASALYGRWLFLFPQRTTGIRIADCFTVTKGVRYGRSNLPRRIYIPSRKNHIHCHACLQRRGRAYA